VIADRAPERRDRPAGGDPARLRVAGVIIGFAVLVLMLASPPGSDQMRYETPEEVFKYGAIGAMRDFGVPYWVWQAMPLACPDRLAGRGLASDFGERVVGFLGGSGGPEAGLALAREGYRAVGLTYEEGAATELPVGLAERRVLGITRVSFNCAVCHLGTVRDAPDSRAHLVLGMPAQRFDVGRLLRFLRGCGRALRQGALIPLIQRLGARLDVLDRAVLYPQALAAFTARMRTLGREPVFTARKPAWGPGRIDLGGAAVSRGIGAVDFPPIWRAGGARLSRHGPAETGRVGPLAVTVAPELIAPVEAWLDRLAPPAYPYRIDPVLAARGGQVYSQYCGRCHGPDGVPEGVTPMVEVASDPHRLRNLAAPGHAGPPLTGIWLAAPYLHNGSVPSLKDLLAPSAERPARFYRGDDVYDPLRVGFRADVPAEGGRRFFEYDTALPGNGNRGHEGRAFGTELGDADKAALLEYLKTL
jgi:mono/diheme cytochrome c family protein